MKYHLEISVHPIRKDENGEDYIDTSDLRLSVITQGEGMSKEEVYDLALSAKLFLDTEAQEDRPGLEHTVGGIWIEREELDTVEFCFRWPDGREEVRYRRSVFDFGTSLLQDEVDGLAEKLGSDECPFPYFYRLVNSETI